MFLKHTAPVSLPHQVLRLLTAGPRERSRLLHPIALQQVTSPQGGPDADHPPVVLSTRYVVWHFFVATIGYSI